MERPDPFRRDPSPAEPRRGGTRIRRTLDGLAVALAVAFCLAAGGRSVAELVRGRSVIPADVAEIAEIGARFESIASALPPRGHVGYFTDRPLSELLGAREFMLAQYFLAPRVLDYGGRRPLAVGRFESTATLEEFLDGSGYDVVGGGPAPRPYVLRRRDDGGAR